jgi:hypothetical protein
MPLSPDLFVFFVQTYICLVVDIHLTLLVKLIAANVQHEYVFTLGYDAPLQSIDEILHDIGANNSLDCLIYLQDKIRANAPN